MLSVKVDKMFNKLITQQRIELNFTSFMEQLNNNNNKKKNHLSVYTFANKPFAICYFHKEMQYLLKNDMGFMCPIMVHEVFNELST